MDAEACAHQQAGPVHRVLAYGQRRPDLQVRTHQRARNDWLVSHVRSHGQGQPVLPGEFVLDTHPLHPGASNAFQAKNLLDDLIIL